MSKESKTYIHTDTTQYVPPFTKSILQFRLSHLQTLIEERDDIQNTMVRMHQLFSEGQYEDAVNLGRANDIFCDRLDGWTYRSVAFKMLRLAKRIYTIRDNKVLVLLDDIEEAEEHLPMTRKEENNNA